MLDQLENFIDVLGKAAHLAYLKKERARIQTAARPKCGNCDFWMKSRECPSEKNINGQTRGPSCEGFACQKFQVSPSSERLFAKLIAENEEEISKTTA